MQHAMPHTQLQDQQSQPDTDYYYTDMTVQQPFTISTNPAYNLHSTTNNATKPHRSGSNPEYEYIESTSN